MRIAAIVDASGTGPWALEPLAGGPSAHERALAFVSSLPGLAGALVLEGETPLPDGHFPRLHRSPWTPEGILEEGQRLVSSLERSGPVDALVLLRGDEPLLDPGLFARMLEGFQRYRAEYSFADGYPAGFSVEILRPRILSPLTELARRGPLPGESKPCPRGWLFAVIQRDINSFDIETEISPLDLRDLRLDLSASSRRDWLLLDRLMRAGVKDAESALALIPGRLELLRTLPAFVQVQVTGGCLQACPTCPWPLLGGDILKRRDHMDRERFAALVGAVADFAGEAVLDLSLWGEPSLHPDIEGLIEEVLARSGLSLIVETSGLGWDEAVLARLSRHPSADRLSWIVSLDAADPELYRRLRGEGWEEAMATAERVLGLFPGRAWVQALRSAEGEDGLEAFWRGWRKRTENVIVQKFSSFAGFLPGKPLSDLSPLVRRPCWHLKRDLAVLLDGSVPLCREDLRGAATLGRLFEEGGENSAAAVGARLAAAWEAGEAWHRRHIAAAAAAAGAAAGAADKATNAEDRSWPSPCADCDEYYTYNA